MKYKLKWSRGAKADLKSIKSHIGQYAPRVAVSFVRRIRDRCRGLRSHPFAAPIVEEIQDEYVRETYLGNYRLIYEIYQDTIVILRVFHGARILTDRELHEPEDE